MSRNFHSLDRRTFAAAAFLAGGVAGAFVFLTLPVGAPIQNLVFDTVGVVSVVAIVVGVRYWRPQPAWPWLLIAAGQAAFVVGDLLWELYDALGETPFPSLADVAYLAGYPLLAIALMAGIRRRMAGGDRGGILDALILTTAATVLTWTFLITPLAASADLDPLGFAISLAYPIADIIVIGVAIGLATAPGSRVPAFWLMLASLGLMLVADEVYALQNLEGSYVDGGLLDVGWMMSYVLMGAAALHPSMVRVLEPRPVPVTFLGPLRLVFLAAAMLTGPALLTVGQAELEPQLLVVAGGTAILSMLVLLRLAGLVGALSDDVERREALEEQLRFQAFHDPLTGLANRRRFVERVDEALAAREAPGALAALFLDIDDFKTVNDSMGHAAGDELLTLVGARLRGATRAGDLAARLGGDEFGVLLEGIDDPSRATDVARRIMDALRDPIALQGGPVNVSISVGVAVDTAAMVEADDLLRDADVAMYRAKAGGKDRYLVFAPPAHEGTAAAASAVPGRAALRPGVS